MKKNLLGMIILTAAAAFLVGTTAMAEAESETEAQAFKQLEAAGESVKSGYEIGMWMTVAGYLDGEEQAVSNSTNIVGFYNGVLLDYNGVVEDGYYSIDGDQMTIGFGDDQTLSGTVTFSNYELSEEEKAEMSEAELAMYDACQYDRAEWTVLQKDNSDPLNPKDVTYVAVLRKVFKSRSYDEFLEVYLGSTSWTLSTGVEMDIDVDGNVTLASGTTGSISLYGNDQYCLAFDWDEADTSYYTVNYVTLTADGFEMTPVDYNGNVKGDAITMTRK